MRPDGGDDYEEPEHLRKLFIGGLDYRTDDITLKEFYEQWGEIVDVVVMKDPHTKRPRGFGFITYSHAYMVDDAQNNRPHTIDGRVVEPKRAVPREEINRPAASATVSEVIVSGLEDNCEEDDLKQYFSRYGNVTSVSITTENDIRKGLVEFDDYDPVDRICLQQNHKINGSKIEVKKSQAKSGYSGGSGGGRGRGSRGGGSGGRGGGGGRSGGGGARGGGSRGGRGGWSSQGGDWGGRGEWGNQGGGYNQSGGGYSQGGGGYNQGGGGYNQGGGGYNQGGGGGYNQGAGGWNNPSPWDNGGPGGNWGSQSSGQQSNWSQQGDNFGGGYQQDYGGGPMRSNYSNQRSQPYNSGGGQGYNTMGNMGNAGGGGPRRF